MSLCVRINGEERTIAAHNVAELIEELGLRPKMIAVERNGEVVPRARWQEETLQNGDRIEIVQMIGGG